MRRRIVRASDDPGRTRRAAPGRGGACARAGRGQVLLRVHCCAVCRTDLHVVDGELPDPRLPLIPGHQIVGTVEKIGGRAGSFTVGDGSGCRGSGGPTASALLSPREPVRERQVHGVPDRRRIRRSTLSPKPVSAFRSLRISRSTGRPSVVRGPDRAPLVALRRRCPEAWALRLRGLGPHRGPGRSARGRRVFAFTSPHDEEAQEFARELGAEWAGSSEEAPPEELDAAIIFAPVGALVPAALRAVARGGTVVCAGIHMSDIPSFPYEILWGERSVRSVANLTRQDGLDFLALAPEVPVRTEVVPFPLEEANEALAAPRWPRAWRCRAGRRPSLTSITKACGQSSDDRPRRQTKS